VGREHVCEVEVLSSVARVMVWAQRCQEFPSVGERERQCRGRASKLVVVGDSCGRVKCEWSSLAVGAVGGLGRARPWRITRVAEEVCIALGEAVQFLYKKRCGESSLRFRVFEMGSRGTT